jgi:hypothetical protein
MEEALKHKIKITNGDCNYHLDMIGTYLKMLFCLLRNSLALGYRKIK